MCQFASFVLTLEKAFWGPTESHTNIIEHHKLVEMGARGPNIIRIEITPPNGKPLAPIAEWIYNVDQDILPEWHDKDLTEQRARTALLLRSQQENWFAVVGSVTDSFSTGGYGATVTGGDRATVTGGDRATVTGGDRATVTGGDSATVTGGYGATVTGGDSATVTGGDGATVTGGDRATVTGGYGATVTGGYGATVTGGKRARVTGGDRATVTGGDGATVTGGDGATVTGGDRATVTGGDGATVTGGELGVISIEYYCNHRNQYRRAIAEVDGVDVLPNVPYVVVDGKLTRKVAE
jgi:hypothetical protein